MSERYADRLRLWLARWMFSPLQGVTLDIWLQALRDNRFAVHPLLWPRALLTTVTAAGNSRAAARELRTYGAAIEAAQVAAPVFILGHYRSGTTHLHNLLAADPRFGFVNNYQANFPRTFLSTEEVGSRLGETLTMRRRPHDRVRLDLRVPTEDELALCGDTLLSPHMGWHFPRRRDWYDRRYLTFAEASAQERQRWIASLRRLARKLTVKLGKPLVFKSPLHTARVPLLLEAFPEARFIHVHRDPYKVFQSTVNMERKVEPLFRYQLASDRDLEERVLWRYREIYTRYLEDRRLIAPGRLTEVGYRHLAAEPLAALAEVYAQLRLPDFDIARPAIAHYVESLRGYRKNVYEPLQEPWRQRVAEEWGFTFREWGYPT